MGLIDSKPIGFSVDAGSDSVTVTIDQEILDRKDLDFYHFEIQPYRGSGESISFTLKKGTRTKRKEGLTPNTTYEIHGKAEELLSHACTETSVIKFATKIPYIINQLSDYDLKIIETKKKEIKDYKLPSKIKKDMIEQVKIACLGRPGSGKSCFYNTIHGIMNDEYLDYSPAGNSYGTICLGPLLEGYLKEGYEDFAPINIKAKYYNGSPTVGDEIHAVAVFYDINNIVSSLDSKMMQEFFEELVKNYKYKPLVILTHCDKYYQEQAGIMHEPNLREIESTIMEDARKKIISEKAGDLISKDDIKFMINYTCEFSIKPRDAYKERHALDIVRTLAKRGQLRISNRLKEIQSTQVKPLPKEMQN